MFVYQVVHYTIMIIIFVKILVIVQCIIQLHNKVKDVHLYVMIIY